MATNVSNITEDIGGFPYILNYLGIYLPYSLISFIAVIVGITGNVLIIAAVFVSKELRKNSTCILITNLAISDLSISLFVNTATVTGVFVGKAFFDRNVAFCVFFGAACLISCATSLLTMGLLAFNRYICIFYNHKYNKYFSVRNTLISSVFSWIIAAILDAPNYIPEIGGHVYDTKTLSCLFDRLKVGYTYAFSIICILLPCTLIGYLYLRIFCHAYHKKTKVIDNSSTNGRSNHRHTMEAVKISKSLFASFFVFAACWVPMAIIYLVGMDNHLPISAHAFTNLPAHLNSAINPIFYGIYNPKIRNGYKNIIRLISCNRFFPDCSIEDSRTNKSSKQPLGLSMYTLNTENKK